MFFQNNINAWEARKRCVNHNLRLATKDEYRIAYNYLSAQNMLKDLKRRKFISIDEDRMYYIYLLSFNDTEMTVTPRSMTDSLGTEIGLICVE